MNINHNLILSELREFMRIENLDFFLLSSTDQYLNEYISLNINSRYFATGFTGSTGDVLVSHDDAHLFVDGRYHLQADDEVDHSRIQVVKLALNQTQRGQIIEIVKNSNKKILRFGLVSSKISHAGFSALSKELENIEFVKYKHDPVLNMIDFEIPSIDWNLRKVKSEISGISAKDKLDLIIDKLTVDVFVVTKLEEIAYLTNLRGNEIPFSSSFRAKAIIANDKCTIFTDLARIKPYENFLGKSFELLDEKEFENYLNKFKNKTLIIGFEQSSINQEVYDELEKTQNKLSVIESPISEMKSIKNLNELQHIKECFLKTDIVMSRVKTWLNQALRDVFHVSEKDLSNKVAQFFEEEGAEDLSFKTIASVGENTAVIHYSNPNPHKFIHKNDLILIDCGAYFEGGYATDITRTFLAGCDAVPALKQKCIYTTVLRAFLHGLNYPFTAETTGFDIDKAVRDIINSNPCQGYSFAHGTGHGVGLTVHETPPGIGPSEPSKTQLKPGMCFTIEPGLYNVENSSGFGVRLENTVMIEEKNGELNIKSLAKSSFDSCLIDYTVLSEQEKVWLENYQKRAIG